MRGILLLCAACSFLSAQQPQYDTLIRDARILDGAGKPAFTGDVAIAQGRIAAVGRLGAASARSTVDAKGLTLAPGFIDTHSHGIAAIRAGSAAESYIRQGVTTIIEGPDGSAPLPLGPFLDGLEKKHNLAVNFGSLAGHNTIRRAVMGMVNRHATPEEIGRMVTLAEQQMRQGAFGLSTGLFYVPGNYAATEEVVAIAAAVGKLGGIHTSHMRNEGANVLDAVKETIRIGEEGHLPTQITHHKIIGKANWGLSKETLRLVEEARARGVDVTIDAYPYTASSTGTGALFPQWSMSGSGPSFRERLAAPDQRKKIKDEIVWRILNDRGAGDAKNIVMTSCGFDKSLAGKSLAQITTDRGREPTPENAAETAIEIQLAGGCLAIYHAISEDDLERILRYPFTMVASDGYIASPGSDMPHPRCYGTFSRVLGLYVRERKVLTLEDAVRKMSSLPAQRFGLRDRGLIRPGMAADLVLFDPATVADKSTYLEPHQYSVGVHSVWINGARALDNGRMTGARPGHVLRGSAYKKP